MGITGILRPTGEFLACNYRNHGVTAKRIPKNEEMKCVYFSSDVEENGSTISIVYFPDRLTILQLFWFIRNENQLDSTQLDLWREFHLTKKQQFLFLFMNLILNTNIFKYFKTKKQ